MVMVRFMGAEETYRLLDVDQPLIIVAVLAQILTVEHRGRRQGQGIPRCLGMGQGAKHHIFVLNEKSLLRFEAGLDGECTDRFSLADALFDVTKRGLTGGDVPKITRSSGQRQHSLRVQQMALWCYGQAPK